MPQILFLTDESVPDGSTVQTNTEFVKKWRMEVHGPPIQAGTTLVYIEGHPLIFNPQPIQPVQDAEFTVSCQFKTPAAPGRYHSVYRLQQPGPPNSVVFGPRLWVSIDVLDVPLQHLDSSVILASILQVIHQLPDQYKPQLNNLVQAAMATGDYTHIVSILAQLGFAFR